jgi:hypothetical protein
MVLIACIVVPVAHGCGREDFETVQGCVYYQGAPLPGGTIVFTPDPDRGAEGAMASGEIGPDGRYSLHTGRHPGARPGWFRVTFAPAPDGPALSMKYGDPERSGQSCEVVHGRSDAVDFHLE